MTQRQKRRGKERRKKNVLVTSPMPEHYLDPVRSLANVTWLEKLGEEELERLTPEIDCIFLYMGWPQSLSRERLARMKRLRFIQSAAAGVNHIPFRWLPSRVVVSSNAGGFSDAVAEFAWALLLSAAKRICYFDSRLRSHSWEPLSAFELGKELLVLKGRSLGILGYGGIGRTVAAYGRAFSMQVCAYVRSQRRGEKGITFLEGRRGFERLLRQSDAIVLSLPLNRSTVGMMGRAELKLTKPRTIIVNVGRAELVDEQAMFEHLVENPDSTYATDVWWTKDGMEDYDPKLGFFSLKNFIGTPHASGPSAVVAGGPIETAVENLKWYLMGRKPRNVVDRSDYT